MPSILDGLFGSEEEVGDQQETPRESDTAASVRRIRGKVRAARRDFPRYSNVEDFVQGAKDLVKRSTMVLGQLGQQELTKIAAMNFEAMAKQHELGLDYELRLEKLGDQGTHLLHSADIVTITVRGVVGQFQALAQQDDPLLTKLMIPIFAAMLTDFVNSATAHTSLLTHEQAEALLTASTVEIYQEEDTQPYRPPQGVSVEFVEVEAEDFSEVHRHNGHR